MKKIQSATEKSKVTTGVVGAFAFGIVGVILWVFLGTVLDVISTFGVIVVVGGVYGGYTLFGKNIYKSIDKKGVVICFVLTLIISATGIFVTAVFDMKSALEETYSVGITLSESFRMLVEMLKVPEVRKLFAHDFIISGVLLLVADVVMAVQLWKEN